MKTNSLLHSISTLSLAALLTSNVLAGPGPVGSSAKTEPERIYDLATRNFIANPAYHEPAPMRQVTRPAGRAAEPRRVYNIGTRNFEPNPSYHDSAPMKRAAFSTKPETEPDRIFDAETGNFEPNPFFAYPL
jgi:hypothetical protein